MKTHVKTHRAWVGWHVLILCWACLVAGCGQGADESKPLDEIRSEAQKMDAATLRELAMAYQKSIETKLSQAGELAGKLKGISPTELLGEKAASLKKELETINQSLNALKARFGVYVEELKRKKGDLSGLNG